MDDKLDKVQEVVTAPGKGEKMEERSERQAHGCTDRAFGTGRSRSHSVREGHIRGLV